MKKIILNLCLVYCVTNTLNAQENRTDFRKNFLLGIKAGANYSNVYDAQGEQFKADAKFGAVAGVFLSIPIGTFLGIQPELLFSQKGFHATGKFIGTNYDFTRTTNYIDIPILFSLKISEFITLNAGPQYSYLLKQKDVFSTNTNSIGQVTEFNNNDIRKNTLCFLAGADINIKHIVLGARAGWDLLNNYSDGSSTNPRYKNVWYQATIGYRFYSSKNN